MSYNTFQNVTTEQVDNLEDLQNDFSHREIYKEDFIYLINTIKLNLFYFWFIKINELNKKEFWYNINSFLLSFNTCKIFVALDFSDTFTLVKVNKKDYKTIEIVKWVYIDQFNDIITSLLKKDFLA